MENQNNMSNQNTPQISQDPVSQPVQIPEKLKINYWMISTIVVAVLLIGVIIGAFFLTQKSCLHPSTEIGNVSPVITTATPVQQANEFEQTGIVIDNIYLHKANTASQSIDQSSPSYQEIKNITGKIITSTLNLPKEKREKITLIVNQEEFLKSSEESDYIEIQSKQLFKDDIEKWKYDKIRFILKGKTGIWGHSSEYEGRSNSNWGPWWGPYDINSFWSLGEFLGVPSPTFSPRDQTGIQHQTTSDDSNQ